MDRRGGGAQKTHSQFAGTGFEPRPFERLDTAACGSSVVRPYPWPSPTPPAYPRQEPSTSGKHVEWHGVPQWAGDKAGVGPASRFLVQHSFHVPLASGFERSRSQTGHSHGFWRGKQHLPRPWPHARHTGWSGLIPAGASGRCSECSRDRRVQAQWSHLCTHTLTHVPGSGGTHLFMVTCTCISIPTVLLTQVHTTRPHLCACMCACVVHV